MKLTLPQQDIYYEQLLYPDEPIYNIGAKIIINGPVVYEMLQRSFVTLIDQHDVFRRIIISGEDGPAMELLPGYQPQLGFMDFSGEKDPAAKAAAYMQETFSQPFRFDEKKPLHRFVLIKLQDTLHYLFSVYHHLITDGWGTSLLFQRWVQGYNELVTDGVVSPRESYDYSDFAVDDAAYHTSSAFEEDKQYWKNRLHNLPENVFPRINENIVNKSSRQSLLIPRQQYNQLEALATRLKCTTFHVILGICYMYLGRRYRCHDFSIGLPVLNRSKAAHKKTVGLFTGMSPLRIALSFDNTFEELVTDIRQQLRQDYRHQRFPLGRLIQELGAFRDRERLFNMTVSYEKQDYAGHLIHTRTTVIPLTHGAERVALAVYIREFDQQEDVCIDFDYHLNYFDTTVVAGMLGHFQQLIQDVCTDSGRPLQEYKYLTAEEEMQVIHAFNQTAVPYPQHITFLTLIKEQAKQRPSHNAVTDGTVTYTYEELDLLSDGIALQLAAGSKAPVAVLMSRTADLVAILLGILKSGNAYIPLDPGFPASRLKYIAEHSKAACIITTAAHRHILDGDTSFMDADSMIASAMLPFPGDLPEVRSADPAYIIYTSGSTGVPKGVVVGHRSLLNFLLSMQQHPGICEQDKLFSVTTPSFDISLLEFFAPLLSGAAVYIAAGHLLREPENMIAVLEAENPTIIQATPGFYQLLYDAGWKGNRQLRVLCGGDLLSTALAGKLLDTCAEVWNMYGPTETTIWSGIKKLQTAEEASNIGKPICNTQFYILDEGGSPVPLRCSGELYIGGEGLALGYHHHPTLTAERFISNPFIPGGRMYKTGDTAAWNDQGEVLFMGRNDHQVKIRGYRIEPGEIEARLHQLPAVGSAVVVANRKPGREAFLVAYVVLKQESTDPGLLISALKQELPDYMIPYTIIPVKEHPLTPNGKVDRKMLASLEVEQLHPAMEEEGQGTRLEAELARLFKDALQWEGAVARTDSFFSLGGNSINAMKLVNQVQQQLCYRLSLKDIFNHPTVRELAAYLRLHGTVPLKGLTVTENMARYPLSPSQYAMWLLANQSTAAAVAYNVSVVYTITGDLQVLQLEQAFMALIGKYEILRTNFREAAGIPYQQVTPATGIQFRIEQITVEDTAKDAALEAYINHTFDLENDLLLRVAVFTTADKRYLAFSSHHILLDGWSVGELVREISGLYGVSEAPQSLLPFQFRDYVIWQQEISAARAAVNERFWRQYLADYQRAPLIPAMPGAEADKQPAAVFTFEWDNLQALKDTALALHSSLHSLLLTGFLTLLHRLYDQKDICIGTVNSGRIIADLHHQIGMFVKTLPLRAAPDPQQYFSVLLKSVHNDLLEMDLHQDLPDDLRRGISPDILFVVQPPAFGYNAVSLGEAGSLSFYDVPVRYARFPLLVEFTETATSLTGRVTYNAALYNSNTIELLFLRYAQLMTQLITSADTVIAALDLQLSYEKETVIDIDFNF